jgi:hypothetical protein
MLVDTAVPFRRNCVRALRLASKTRNRRHERGYCFSDRRTSRLVRLFHWEMPVTQYLLWVLVTSGLIGPAGAVPAWTPDVVAMAPAPNTSMAGPVLPMLIESAQPVVAAADAGQHRQRPRPIEYSDAYYVRLKIHEYASYAMLPLFIAEYFVGRSLYNNPETASRSLRGWHNNLAVAIGGLFTLNTVTGVWNLWEGRKDPAGRTRRMIHGISMLVADAGFLVTAKMTPDREFRRSGGTIGQSSASTHRAIAISSMSISLASDLLMLIWNK